jgi:acyl-CoA oxidase
MKNSPEKFFLAHRLLSSVGLSGFGIRFTVQFNLFAGSVLGLGNKDQVAYLSDNKSLRPICCLLLKKNQSGVLSGLIVKTTAHWVEEEQKFVLHTPDDKAAKNWISQGYTAEMGVVVADLIVEGKSHGPHAFLMHLRDDKGDLLPGIRIQDMGTKTVANDLDNARVWFDKVSLPKSSMLSKFAEIDENGKYHQVTEERMRIEVIGQRLLTGRQAIAEAALVSAKCLHMKTEEYANQKVCNGLGGEVPLSSMPQVRNCFTTSYAALDDMIQFAGGVEQRLSECLRNDTIPSPDLVDAIAVCKIKAIEVAIKAVHALRQEVGSYGLMYGTGFELVDMLLCCKFAEGDSRILMQKLARDRLKRVMKEGALSTAVKGIGFSPEAMECRAALKLARVLAPAGRDNTKMAQLLDEHWELVYELAEAVAASHLARGQRHGFIEGDTELRFVPANVDFDHNWKQKLGSGENPSVVQ